MSSDVPLVELDSRMDSIESEISILIDYMANAVGASGENHMERLRKLNRQLDLLSLQKSSEIRKARIWLNQLAIQQSIHLGQTREEYILQGAGNQACMLVAVMNALRYFGHETPGPSDPEWLGLCWATHCDKGDPVTKDYEDMFSFFSPINAEQGGDTWPRIVSVDDPEVEDTPGAHAIFEPELGVVVNYRYARGPVAERVTVTPRTLGTIGSPWWSLKEV